MAEAVSHGIKSQLPQLRFETPEHAESIVLASILLKTKPAGLPVRECLLLLKNNLNRSSRTAPTASQIECTQYWKAAHAVTQDALIVAQARLRELEQESIKVNSGLRSRTSSVSTPNVSKKRGRDNLSEPPTPGQSRKRRRLNLQSLAAKKEQARVKFALDELELSLPSTEANTYLRHLYSLQQILQQEAPDTSGLAAVLVQLSSDSMSIVSKTKPETPPITPPVKDLNVELQTRAKEKCFNRLALIGRTFIHLASGLSRLGTGEASEGLRSQVIYSYIKIFDTILDQVRDVSNGLLTNDPAENLETNKRKRQSVSSGMAENSAHLLQRLSRIVIEMLASLDVSNDSHQSVIEGSMHSLLSRVGTVLSVFTFGDYAKRPARSVHDTDLVTGSHRVSSPGSEAIYLVWILERALLLMRRRSMPVFGQSSVRSRARSRMQDPASSKKPSLVDPIGVKIQNTMLKATFPDDHGSFEDRLFAHPDPEIDALAEMPTIRQEDVPNWFKQEVWRLVGWSVLGSQMQQEFAMETY